MPEPRPVPRPAVAGRWPAAAIVLLLVACSATESVSPGPSVDSASPPSTASAQPSTTAAPTATSQPTPTPAPDLSLDLPPDSDPRQVAVSVVPEVPADGGGGIIVTVTNLSDTRVTELVLRWNTELSEVLFLAPFEPAEARVIDGGPPLLQPWTKWVLGPGERGEPAGTTSLGWGPLDPGAELRIPLVVTRRAPGPVAFDLQLLADEAILHLEDGEPAELRVSVP